MQDKDEEIDSEGADYHQFGGAGVNADNSALGGVKKVTSLLDLLGGGVRLGNFTRNRGGLGVWGHRSLDGQVGVQDVR